MQKTQIHIRRGETVNFPIVFIPIEKDTYHCKIIFCNNVVGEFQHELTGITDLPENF